MIRGPNWLGDLLMSTAFVRAVLALFPGAGVDLIVPHPYLELPLPHRGRLIGFDRGADRPGALGRQLRGQGYSHFFVLPPSFSAAWMAYRSGIPHRIGYGGQLRGWLLKPALRHRHAPRSVHLVREYLDLLRPWREVGLQDYPARLEPPPGWVENHLPAGFATEPPPVVMAPGAEYGPAKQWPIAHYARTAAALAEAGRPIVVVGLAQDREAGEAILTNVPGGSNLCGHTDLKALAAVMARAALVISNDSGAMHLAAALGRPQLALFGSTNPDWTGPLNPRAQVITRSEPCAPCYARKCPLEHFRCFNDLAPDPVIESARALLFADHS